MSLNGLHVSEVILFPIQNKVEGSKLLSYAKVILNDQFAVTGIRIVNGKNGPFLGFPQRYDKDADKAYDIAFPITAELRSHVSEKVLAEYNAREKIAA
jgi:stage V sporulation protein G